MQANTGRRRDPSWAAVRQRLLADGSLTRYKISSSHPVATLPSRATTNSNAFHRRLHDGQSRDEDEMEIIPRQQSQLFPAPLSLYGFNIGGLRGDPFNMYPIESKGCVQGAFDYYAEVYAPLAIRRPEVGGAKKDTKLLQAYWHQALHDAMLFEVVIAFSQVLQVLHKPPTDRMSPEVLYYSGRSLQKLQKRLTASAEYNSDIVLVTVITMMGVDYMTGNIDAFKAHLKGLRHLVALRGGVEKLGLNGFIKSRVINWETFWAHREKQLDGQKHHSDKVPYNGLVYPNHPFSSEMCAKISKLPPGISELALSRRLCTRVIDLAESYSIWLREMQDLTNSSEGTGDTHQNAVRVPGGADAAVAVLECSGLRTIERCLVIALLAFTIAIDVKKVVLSSLHPYVVQTQVKILPHLDGMNESDRDFLVWVAIVLRATMGVGTAASLWASKVIHDLEKQRGKECDLNKLNYAFFPLPDQRLSDSMPRQD